MRPQILFPLFAPIASLPGIGPKLAPLVARAAGGEKIADLIWHRPTGIVDRRTTPKLAQALDGAIATLIVTVDQHQPPRTPSLPYKVRCRDETGFLHLVFFRAKAEWLNKLLPIGEQRVISGKVERFRDEIQITHPDHVVPIAEFATVAIVEPVYGLTAGVSARIMARTVRSALERAPLLEEWLDPALVRREGWPGWHEALHTLHAPQEIGDLAPDRVARRRLA